MSGRDDLTDDDLFRRLSEWWVIMKNKGSMDDELLRIMNDVVLQVAITHTTSAFILKDLKRR
jgi:hypothetical protein